MSDAFYQGAQTMEVIPASVVGECLVPVGYRMPMVPGSLHKKSRPKATSSVRRR